MAYLQHVMITDGTMHGFQVADFNSDEVDEDYEHTLSANRGLPAIGGEQFLLSRVLAQIAKEPWRARGCLFA